MATNPLHCIRKHSDRIRDLVGFGFFLFATLISGLAAWQHPSILAWLFAIHNGLLAFFYTRRTPAKQYDRTGLWLGMIAAFLPTFTTSSHSEWYLLIPALAGYSLILWSLITLGSRFGVAPADRGLTSRGPYRFLRHPMYLGELVFRAMMVFSFPDWFTAILLSVALTFIQCWRILREEKMINGYACYMRIVTWRLIPGLW
ncbi:MAG: isoprenylcysteine carboxylmethyltransferase family protein [Anaerolineae bacterium]|nr:isoprenylcysteine carboxylmethyltransferase family protein [Anaerolineae bacterium]